MKDIIYILKTLFKHFGGVINNPFTSNRAASNWNDL